VPHKIFAPDAFASQVAQLRSNLTDSNCPGYLIKTSYSKGIPADGFCHFAESIWAKIASNKDLDLPSQQELLSQYRCDEIFKQSSQNFVESIKPFKNTSDQIILDFSKSLSPLIESALAFFDTDASRYNANVYKAKRIELQQSIFSHLQPIFSHQTRLLRKEGLALFEKKLQQNFDDSNFSTNLQMAKTAAFDYYKTGLTGTGP
jgi:hypothetical protein